MGKIVWLLETNQRMLVSDQDKEPIHALPVHLLQLLPDPVQLQHQAVHLQGQQEVTSRAGLACHRAAIY